MCFTFRYIKSINYLKNLLNSDGYIFSIIPDMRYTFDRKRKLTTIEHLIQDYKTDVDHYDKTHIDDYINNFDHHWDISDVLEGLDNFYDSKVATVFTQLKLGNKTMFGKKVVIPNRHDTEMENINLAYQHISSDKLIKFYGYHETYGFLFEWVDDFKYLNRTKLTVGSVELVDVDVIEINGVKKYIDFER